MKAFTRVISICLLAIMMTTILVSCGPSMSDVAGTYTGTYTYNGSFFSVAIVLEESGSYAKATAKDGKTTTETGTFEIDGDEVVLHKSGNSSNNTRYTYTDGQLENNGHIFKK